MELLDELEGVMVIVGCPDLVVAVDVAPLVAGGAGNSNVGIGVVLALVHEWPADGRPLLAIHLLGAEDALVDGDDLVALRVVEGQPSLAVDDHGRLLLDARQLGFALSWHRLLLGDASALVELLELLGGELLPVLIGEPDGPGSQGQPCLAPCALWGDDDIDLLLGVAVGLFGSASAPG